MLIRFEDIKHKLNNSKWYGTQAWYEILDIIGDCDDESRPKGKWIKRSSVGNWECSLCGSNIIVSEPKLANYNYCPNCGERMKGKE